MALTITSPLPSTYSVNANEGNITLTIAVSSDQPSLSAVTFEWSSSAGGISSKGNANGIHPNYTKTLNIPAYSEGLTGLYSVTLLEYAADGTPIYSGSVSDEVYVTVYPEGYVPEEPEELINGRTPDEHRRMRLLGYI